MDVNNRNDYFKIKEEKEKAKMKAKKETFFISVNKPGYNSKENVNLSECIKLQNIYDTEIKKLLKSNELLRLDLQEAERRAQEAVVMPRLVKAKFIPPITIAYFDDGTYTKVEVQKGEKYYAEKGLAMAYIKRTYDNKSCYLNDMKAILQNANQKEIRELDKDRLAVQKERVSKNAEK